MNITKVVPPKQFDPVNITLTNQRELDLLTALFGHLNTGKTKAQFEVDPVLIYRHLMALGGGSKHYDCHEIVLTPGS